MLFTQGKYIKPLLWFLAFTILYSSVGIVINIHVCHGKTASISFYSESNGCGMEQNNNNCTTSGDLALNKKNCCSNEHFYNQAEIVAHEQQDVASLLSISCIASITATFKEFIHQFNFTYKAKTLETFLTVSERLFIALSVFRL